MMQKILGKDVFPKIKDPYADEAKHEIERMAKVSFEDIEWIEKDGSSFFAEDIHPIIMRDLLKCGWSVR